MLDFPSAPTTGQVFDDWIWDGAAWVFAPVSATVAEPWQLLTLTSGWKAYSNTVPQYRRRGDIVDLHVQVVSGASGLTTLITQLPLGYRPLTVQFMYGQFSGGGSPDHAELIVETNGEIRTPFTPTRDLTYLAATTLFLTA